MPGNFANVDGYWESTTLAALNDRVLDEWRATWWQPPATVTAAMLHAVAGTAPEASARFAEVFGTEGGWVWKDPRLTVLLPFWESVLGGHPVLFVHRSPWAVARSIAARDGLTTAQALALWERHTRLSLAALAGRNVLVEGYGALCERPAAWLRRVAEFCRGAGLEVQEPSRSADLGVRPSGDDGIGALTTSQRALLASVSSLGGPHDAFPTIDLEPETPEMRRLLDAIAPPAWLAPLREGDGGGEPDAG